MNFKSIFITFKEDLLKIVNLVMLNTKKILRVNYKGPSVSRIRKTSFEMYYVTNFLINLLVIIWTFLIIFLNFKNIVYCGELDYVPLVISAEEEFILYEPINEYQDIFGKPPYEIKDVVIPKKCLEVEVIDSSSSSYSSDLESETELDVPYIQENVSSTIAPQNIHLRDPNVILKEFSDYRSRGSNEDEVRRLSLEYLEHLIPADLWPTSKEQINDRTYGVNAYLDKFLDKVYIKSDLEAENFINFNASLVTKNYQHAYPTLQNNQEAIVQIYNKAVNNLKKV